MRRICLIIRKLFLIKIIDTPYLLKQMRRMALMFREKFFLSKTDTPYLPKQTRRITLSLRKNFLIKNRYAVSWGKDASYRIN